MECQVGMLTSNVPSLAAGSMDKASCDGCCDHHKPYIGRRYHLPADFYPTMGDFGAWAELHPAAMPFYNAPCPGGTHSCCDKLHRDLTTLIVSVDGACRGNGTPRARMSHGVFFRPDSPWNVSFAAPVGEQQQQQQQQRATNQQRAELTAATHALQMVATGLAEASVPELHFLERKWATLVVKTDSEYVVKGACEWVFKWKDNGWLNNHGQPVANEDLFEGLEELIHELESAWEIKVKFLHVPREQNTGADGLANRALDEWEAANPALDV